MQLTAQYPDLSKMFGQDSLYNTLYGMDQFNAAQQNDASNLAQATQDRDFQAQKLPGELANQQAINRHTNALAAMSEAQTPGAVADSAMKTRANDVDASVPMDTKRKAAVSKIAAQLSDDTLKQATDHVKTLMVSNDPKERAQGEALWPHLSEIAAEKMKLDSQKSATLGAAAIAADAHIKGAQIAADASKQRYSSEYSFRKAMTGNFQSQSGAWMSKAVEAQDAAAKAQDPEEKQFYLQNMEKYAKLADMARAADKDAKAASAYTNLTKSPDLAAMAGIPTVVPAAGASKDTAVNPLLDKTPAPTPTPSAVDTGKVLMRSPDGKVYSVPKDKVKDAAARGWTAGQQAAPQIPN